MSATRPSRLAEVVRHHTRLRRGRERSFSENESGECRALHRSFLSFATVCRGRLSTRRRCACTSVSFRLQNGNRRAAQGGDGGVRILGALEVEDDSGQISLGGRKQRALLALLLLRANEVVSADRLIDLLWTDDPPADASKALQVHISRLRRALESDDALQTRAGGYLLSVDPSFDLAQFEERAAEGQTCSLPATRPGRATRWRRPRPLARPPLADLAREPFAHAEIARLEEQRLTC